MPTPHPRSSPTQAGGASSRRGGGLEERQQLRDLAELLAANPKLKPMAAIRSLGVDDPAAMRRLNTRFRREQGRLMADARRARPRERSLASRPTAAREAIAEPVHEPAAIAAPTRAPEPALQRSANPATALVESWCDIGFAALAAAVEVQSSFAQFWLAMPAVTAAARTQLVVGSVAVAVRNRCKSRPIFVR